MAARFVDVLESQIFVFVLFSRIITNAILLKQLVTSGSVNIAIVSVRDRETVRVGGGGGTCPQYFKNYVRDNSSRERPPRANWHLKKMIKCPALRAIFIGKCPAPRSFYDGPMPGPPVHPTNLQKYWLPFYNKHNCFSSIELHKTGRNESPRSNKEKANGFIAFIGILWSINALLNPK